MIVRVLLGGLWQGAAIVGIAYFISRSVSRRNATTRYAVWFAALLALVAVPALAAVSNAGARLLADLQPRAGSSTWTLSLVPVQSLVYGAASVWSPAMQWLAAFWAAGAGIGLARLGASVVGIDRIRKNAAVMSTDRADVLVSADVTVPLAVGFLKPAIIIPKHMLGKLAPADLERIIEHERAHIRRHDVLANLVQRLLESCLFFNPWVYIIGRNLVLEREAACDDWVVSKTGDPDEYAACLASLARSLRQPRAQLATPSVLGSRHSLVERIERLAGNASRRIALNYYVMGGTVMLFVLLTLAIEAFSPAQAFEPAHTISTLGASAGSLAAACTKPNAEAAVTDPAQPKMPPGLTVKGSAIVAVTIAPNGSVAHASVSKSSGNARIDQAVLDAATHSKYSPKLVNCQPVEGKYLFRADFIPKPH
jgi:TonB family protein